jgi:hypothetical protein
MNTHIYDPKCLCSDCCNYELTLALLIKKEKKDKKDNKYLIKIKT